MTFLESSKHIGGILSDIPKLWDGRKSILEMKESGFAH
jgi:hypothetical protein